MDRETARAELKPRLEEYLQGKGIKTRQPFLCLNPAHPDKKPSMSYNRKANNVHCFSCGATYDIFDLIGLEYGLTESKDIFDKAYSLYGLTIDNDSRRDVGMYQNQPKTEQPTQESIHTVAYTQTPTQAEAQDFTAYYRESQSRISATTYLQERGLSAETLERHMVGYDPAYKTKDSKGNYVQWRAVIIPTGKGSYVARNTDTAADHSDRYRKRGSACIFGLKTLRASATPVFVVEGEIDAMSIEEAGGSAIGLGSLDNVSLFLRALEKNKPTTPLIIALDEEAEASKRDKVSAKVEELEKGLKSMGITFYKYNPYGQAKDANEALTTDREAFIQAIASAANIEKQAEEEEREKYLSDNQISRHIQSFIDGIGASVDTPAIPTGFSKLDSVLDGGLYEGLIIMGAISSLGKTSLALQICDQIAAAGHDVLIFSLEMGRAELMAKSISRHTLQIAQARGQSIRDAKTARGITASNRYVNYSKAERELIKEAAEAYSAYTDRLFIQEGVGDIGITQIRETIEKHIAYTGRTPLILVDYLQILAPYNERATDKQNTDKAVLELKRISRDYKTPVIAISSFNRTSYNESVAMEAFKESGAIEYSSDLLIGLQLKGAGAKDFNPTEAKKRDPRQIELVILKNRNGPVGDKVQYSFYPLFNYLRED